MSAFREVSVRLADGSTEVGYFKERPDGSGSLEIGVEVHVGQRVSFVGTNSEFEVKRAAWKRHAQWCHVDLIKPTPRRLPAPGGPAPAPAQVEQTAQPETNEPEAA